MLVSLSDVAKQCPLGKWKDYIHTLRVELVTGEMLVMRGSLRDITGFKCTADTLRVTPLLQNKPENVLDAIANLVNGRWDQIATEQVKIAELSAAIVTDMRDGTLMTPVFAIVANIIRSILEGYEPHATLAGWPNWLNLCEAYLIGRGL